MKKLFLLLLCTLAVSQTKLETRVYEFSNGIYEQQYQSFNLSDITNNELSDNQFALVKVFGYSEDTDLNGNCYLHIQKEYNGQDTDRSFVYFKETVLGTVHIESREEFVFEPSINHSIKAVSGDFIGTLKLAITAEFPIEDTGYLEENFEYCVDPGYNLISYPCDSPIAITDAIPYEVTSNMSSVIGEGAAGINVNGNWIGSLSEMQPGSGYWLSASTSMCFNFDCQQ